MDLKNSTSKPQPITDIAAPLSEQPTSHISQSNKKADGPLPIRQKQVTTTSHKPVAAITIATIMFLALIAVACYAYASSN